MAAPHPHRLHFGLFEIDLAAGELRKSGIKIKLQDQPFQVLTALLERPGEIVTREDLRQKIWPADTFVDFDQSLNKAVNKIREALRDSADRPRFVETVPRRGYRFVAPVLGQRAASEPPLSQVDAPVRKPWLRPAIVVGAVCILTALVFTLLRSPPPLPGIVRSVQISRDGRQKGFSVVTDGARVYFSGAEAGRMILWQTSSSGGESQRIPTPFAGPRDDVTALDISADAKELLVSIGESAEFWVMPSLGGSGRRLGELRGQDAAWSPDQKHVAYARRDELHLATSDGVELSTVVKSTGQTIYRPRWSPDGSRLRFSAWYPNPERLAIWEVAVDGSNLNRRFPSWQVSHGGGSWAADGKYFVFESEGNLWGIRERSGIFRKTPRQPVQLTFGPIAYWPPAPSPDGRKLYARGDFVRGELLRYDFQSRRFDRYLPDLSADGLDFQAHGDWLCYTTYPEGELWRSKVDGSQKLQLSSAPLRAYLPRWSPDGKQIAFMGKAREKPWKIYLVSSAGGRLEELMKDGTSEADPNWSPDGNRLVFAPWPWEVFSDVSRVYIVDLKTRQKSIAPGSERLYSPRWSPQGAYIAAITEKGGHVMLFDLKSSRWTTIAEGPADFPMWSRDGRYIYFYGYSRAISATRTVVRVEVHSRKVEQMADCAGVQLTSGVGGIPWMGLTADRSPLILRDVGGQEIYALEWETP